METVEDEYDDDNIFLTGSSILYEELPPVVAEPDEVVDAFVIYRVLTIPKALESDRCLRHSIFRTTCTTSANQGMIIFDSGSTKNLVFQNLVEKLGLKIEKLE